MFAKQQRFFEDTKIIPEAATALARDSLARAMTLRTSLLLAKRRAVISQTVSD